MGSQPVGRDWVTELNWLTETLKSGNEMNRHNSNSRQNNVKIITEIEYKNYQFSMNIVDINPKIILTKSKMCIQQIRSLLTMYQMF